jgi:hypothetical protein
MPQIAGLVGAVGVHHRERRRQRRDTLVMVEHDHVAAGGGDGLMAQRAAVDADDQVVRRAETAHRRHVRAVTLLDPVGDVERRRMAERAQPVQQERRRSAAVDVVIGEDRDALAAPQRGREAGGGGVHVAQARGIGHQVAQARREIGRRLNRCDPARGKHAAHDLGHAGCIGDGEAHAHDPGLRAEPAPAGRRGRDIEKGRRRGRIG